MRGLSTFARQTVSLLSGLTVLLALVYGVLLLAGFNLLAIGLLGEMQVRHYHEPAQRAPYSVERLLRAQSEESTISE